MRISYKKLSLIIILVLLALALPAGITATPSSKKAQLGLLKNQVDSINQQIDEIDEEYLQAKIKLSKINTEFKENSQALLQTQKRLASAKRVLSKRIRALYMQGSDSSIEFILSTTSFNELLTNLNFLERVGNSDALLIKKVFKLSTNLQQAKNNIKNNLAYQKKLVASIADKKIAIEAEIERKKRLIGNLQEDLRSYEQEQAKQQIKLSASIAPVVAPPSAGSRGEQVVQIAKQYLGVPYRWGGASPSTGFDCSGFTMFVYAKVGVGLPHSSRAQFGVGQAVPQNALQPGDLVFRGNPRIHHVGIYVGGGQMISAPQTGDVVKFGPAFTSHYAGARRP